jgi:hypothetical protein
MYLLVYLAAKCVQNDRESGQECCIMMLVQSMVMESKDKHGAMVLFL